SSWRKSGISLRERRKSTNDSPPGIGLTMIAEAVLDSSAIIAAFLEEPGGDRIEQVAQLRVSAVNLAEVVSVLMRQGYDPTAVETAPLGVEPFERADALEVGRMLSRTRAQGLSFGDCACLALAKRLGLPVLTGDRIWAT